MNKIITLDLMLTGFGFILSLFLIIYSTLLDKLILLLIGIFIAIPSIVHTIDGMTRRCAFRNIQFVEPVALPLCTRRQKTRGLQGVTSRGNETLQPETYI